MSTLVGAAITGNVVSGREQAQYEDIAGVVRDHPSYPRRQFPPS
jgi:hypothetical protein